MAWDEGLAEIMRKDLAGEPTREQKMFGGICFMRAGHMLCGVHKNGALFRVGKAHMTEALTIPGASPMRPTGRPMGGMVELDAEAAYDAARRGALLAFAFDFVKSLPAKAPGPIAPVAKPCNLR